MAAKMTTMFGDVTDLQQRHHPKNIPHFVEKMKGFPLKAKSFRNTATYERLKGKGGGLPPCTTVGYDFVCTFEASKRTYINRGDVSHPPCFKLYQ